MQDFEERLNDLLRRVEALEKEGGPVKVIIPRSQRKKAFVKPTKEEALAYAKEKGHRGDVEGFFDHYEANGWMIGKNKMRSWQHALSRAIRDGWASGKPVARKAVKPKCKVWGCDKEGTHGYCGEFYCHAHWPPRRDCGKLE